MTFQSLRSTADWYSVSSAATVCARIFRRGAGGGAEVAASSVAEAIDFMTFICSLRHAMSHENRRSRGKTRTRCRAGAQRGFAAATCCEARAMASRARRVSGCVSPTAPANCMAAVA